MGRIALAFIEKNFENLPIEALFHLLQEFPVVFVSPLFWECTDS
jgi:hypothetical protein